jgi:hypothetical protein
LEARVTTLLRDANYREKDGTTTMTVTVLAASKESPRCCGGERDGARRGGEL